MSVHTSQKTTTTYRTLSASSPEPVTSTVISPGPVSPLPYTMNGNYETVRYLVPMQQAVQQQSYIPIQQPMMQQQSYVLMQQPMMQQPMMQQVSPVYLQSLPRLSVSSQESADLMYHQQQSTMEVSPTRSRPGSDPGQLLILVVKLFLLLGQNF